MNNPSRICVLPIQEAVCEVLVSKLAAAIADTGISRLVVAGGVACTHWFALRDQKNGSWRR